VTATQRSSRVLLWFLVIGLFAGLAQAGAAEGSRTRGGSGSDRQSINLDGTWAFATDPVRVGEDERWFQPERSFPRMPRPGYAEKADGQIQVPGIWDAQGYGTETDKVRHNFVGLGWYRRSIRIPAGWAGRRVFLCLGGVHRYAKVWVNGRLLGEHIGYLSAFEFEVTEVVAPGSDATIVIQVDSRQRYEQDTLFGASDLADYMDVAWGGIWGHVTLEARSAAWLGDLFVQSEAASGRCSASATLAGDTATADGVQLEVRNQAGHLVAQNRATWSARPAAGERVSTVVTIPQVKLWSPDQPTLYRARLSLLKSGQVIDAVETRFGVRDLRIEGFRLKLNGQPLFLRGYGDDHIYPDRMAMPADKDYHLRRLRLIKQYGFNHVRHHSTILPPEYYDACDEVGIMPTAEFPIVYDSFLPDRSSWRRQVPPDTDSGPAWATYQREWAAAIKRHRNHPCILAWVMGNELWEGIPLRQEFRRVARELDPARPFADSDGVTEMWQHILDPKNDRDTLDLYFLMFDVAHNPLDMPDKYRLPHSRKPIISHESGNYVTFTRPEAASAFRHNIKPFWMTEGQAKLASLGLRGESEQWARASERLYLTLHQRDLEALRLNPEISGYHWWLFQDYWTTANGLVDHYFHPKSIRPEEVRRFNSDVVVLQQGLDLTYRAQQRLQVKVLVSNFSARAFDRAPLRWELATDSGRVFARQQVEATADAGALAEAAQIDLALPEVSNPTRLRLRAEIAFGGQRWRNDWTSWLYPAAAPPSARAVPVLATPGQYRRWPNLGLQPLPKTGPLPNQAVYLAGSLSQRIVTAVEQGASLVLMNGGRTFPSRPLTYRSSWWKAGDDLNANLCGTVAYRHPVIRAMAPDGWCDPGWFHLLEGGRKIVLESFPARPEVLIRALPSLRAVEDCAALFEVGVGQGTMLVSGLNHVLAAERPENEWLLNRLLDRAAAHPRLAVRWPATALPPVEPEVIGQRLSGFTRVVRNEGEKSKWFSGREDRAPMFVCRQTEPGHDVEWETATVPADVTDDSVTFVFAGGLGWRSQPKTSGFTLLVNGRATLAFDLPDGSFTWASADGKATLRFLAQRNLDEDQVGLFQLTLPRSAVELGQPCHLTIRSEGRGSQRWFGLHPYADVADDD